jgi:hypothetical protein
MVAATKQLMNRRVRRQAFAWGDMIDASVVGGWSVGMRAADALFVTLPRHRLATPTRDP